jgi:hypothetical protein
VESDRFRLLLFTALATAIAGAGILAVLWRGDTRGPGPGGGIALGRAPATLRRCDSTEGGSLMKRDLDLVRRILIWLQEH